MWIRPGLSRHIAGLAFIIATIAFWPRRASAYPFMIRHDYSACTQCHADPSGGSLLTQYGRAQSETLLRTRYEKPNEEEEPGALGQFLFGAVKLPDSVLVGGDFRLLQLWVKPASSPLIHRSIWMQSDAQAQVALDRFRANLSVGYADEGSLGAAVTSRAEQNVVSRVHWVGADLGEDRQFLVRAGRMNLPFGVRSVEHTEWVRTSTRTDTKDAQQHGVAFAYNGDGKRGEVMAILGNLQLHPADYRDYGYSGYFELSPLTRLAVGVSSLVVHSEHDLQLGTPVWRHAHGLFGRYSPVRWLVLSAESDMLVNSQPATTLTGAENRIGNASLLQADFEVIQGLHLMATGETLAQELGNDPLSLGAWGSVWWFFLPHADMRVDAIFQSIAAGPSRVGVASLLGQIHLFL